MSESKEIRIMRYMQWEKAKGNLQAMLHTYWSSRSDEYENMAKAVNLFVKTVEENGLQY